MSADLLERMRAFYAAVTTGDMAACEAQFDPDRIVIHEAESLPYGGVYRGIAGYRELARKLGATWKRVRFDDLTFTLGDNMVMAKFTMTATSRATGTATVFPVVEVFHLEGDKILSIQPFYWDTHDLRTVLGVA